MFRSLRCKLGTTLIQVGVRLLKDTDKKLMRDMILANTPGGLPPKRQAEIEYIKAGQDTSACKEQQTLH